MPYGWLFTLHICSDVAILPTSLTCPQSPLLNSFLPTFNFFSSLITVQHTDLLERCLGSSPLEARLYQTGDLRLCLWLSLTVTTIPRMLQSLGKELILASRRFHWRHIVPISHTASHFSLPYDFQGYYHPAPILYRLRLYVYPFFHFLGTQCLVPEHSLGVWEFWLSMPKTAQLEGLLLCLSPESGVTKPRTCLSHSLQTVYWVLSVRWDWGTHQFFGVWKEPWWSFLYSAFS